MKFELVHNWKNGWKWFSTWAFALIVFFANVSIPPDVMKLIPDNIQPHVISFVAICGLILRFVNQTHRCQGGDDE